MGDTCIIDTLSDEGSFSAYVARPQSTPKAAIVVIQEIFGVNAGIRQKCDKLATEGYLAYAPDLFWRLKPGIELNADVPAEFKTAIDYMMQYNQDEGITDIQATINAARADLGGGKVGCVGYCMGGRLTFMSACRTDADAFAGYYAVGIDTLLHEQHAIGKPVILHLAGDDHFVPADIDHGFATELGDRRDAAGAELADQRTAELFTSALA